MCAFRSDADPIGEWITSPYLPARHDAITARSPAGVRTRPSKLPKENPVPVRRSQVVLSRRNKGRVLDFHPTRKQFLVSAQTFPPVPRPIPVTFPKGPSPQVRSFHRTTHHGTKSSRVSKNPRQCTSVNGATVRRGIAPKTRGENRCGTSP